MAKPEINAIEFCAKRSDRTVMFITSFFALGGTVLGLLIRFLDGMKSYDGPSTQEALWIPLCFLTIPLLHYLCRQIHALEKRIDELEKLSTHNAG